MLLYNINNQFLNGSRGKFIDVEKSENTKGLLVHFPKDETVTIDPRMILSKRSIQASKTSNYMNAIAVHSSQEFVFGQTYVTLSRVGDEGALQVIGMELFL